MIGSADGPAQNGDGTSADAGMTKYRVLMSRHLQENIVKISPSILREMADLFCTADMIASEKTQLGQQRARI